MILRGELIIERKLKRAVNYIGDATRSTGPLYTPDEILNMEREMTDDAKAVEIANTIVKISQNLEAPQLGEHVVILAKTFLALSEKCEKMREALTLYSKWVGAVGDTARKALERGEV